MTNLISLSPIAANYIQNSPLGLNASNAGAEDKNINDIVDEKTSLTDKARYVDANTSIVQASKKTMSAGTVGIKTDVQFKFKDKDGTLDKDKNDKAEADWRLFCKKEFFESTELGHCNYVMRLVVEAETGAEGEVLVLHHHNALWKYGYKIQLLETSMIDVTNDKQVEYVEKNNKPTKEIKEHAVIGGLQIGKWGEPIGVYVYDDQTKSSSTLKTKHEFTLYFNAHLRISQYRGISKFSGIIGTLQDTLSYKDNELESSAASASTKYVHKTPQIKPLRIAQEQYWENIYAAKNGIPTISDFSAEDQSNSPTAYIGMDEELTALTKTDMKSTYSTFIDNLNKTVGQNFNVSPSMIMQGEDSAVFAVVKAKKQENETTFGIERDNLEQKLFETIVNNFIEANYNKWDIADFYTNKYKYLYAYKITMGTKTELDEVKSANARRLNKEGKVIDSYQASLELGNDYDTVVENNTRAKQKDIKETIKILKSLEELNKVAEPLGMKYKLDENNNIVQAEEVVDVEVIQPAAIELKSKQGKK